MEKHDLAEMAGHVFYNEYLIFTNIGIVLK